MKPRQPKNEQLSLKYFRDWSTARDVAREGSGDLAEVVKNAAHALDVAAPAFKLACKWQRDPDEAIPQIRHLKRLCVEFGLTDENFNPLQTDLEDAIQAAGESVI